MRTIRTAVAGLGILFALVAPVRAAQGVNLTWSRCHGEGIGTQARAFACDTNDGSEVLVGSFVLDAPLAQVNGNEVTIDLISEDDPLPAWWEFKDLGTCRLSSLSMNLLEDPADVVCADWQGGAAEGGVGAYTFELGTISPELVTRHRRLKIALAVKLDAIADLAANTEYFSCNVVINHAKTVGASACGGCEGSVCLVFASLWVTTQTPGNDVSLTGGTTPGSDMAHWQGTGADCLLVPVRNRTWGQVKALYR